MRLDEIYWFDLCYEIESYFSFIFFESENEIKSEEDNYLVFELS